MILEYSIICDNCCVMNHLAPQSVHLFVDLTGDGSVLKYVCTQITFSLLVFSRLVHISLNGVKLSLPNSIKNRK